MQRKIFLFLPFIFLFSGLTFSKPIDYIEIKGNKYVADELIKRIILSKEGEEYSEHRVREDIKRLFRTGFFKKIEVYKEETDDRVKLIYVVEDLPVIYKIEFEGNEELDDEDLSEKLGIETEVGKIDVDELLSGYTSSPAVEERLEIQRKLKLGRVLSEKEIDMIVRRIKEIYREEGFPDVEVSYRIVPKKGVSKLVFHIRENAQKYVVDIYIAGNETFSDGTLKSLMDTQERNILIFRLKPTFDEDILKEDVKKIERFYKDEGFLEVKVHHAVDSFSDGGHNIYIIVKEGPRYKLRNFGIEGNSLFSQRELVGDILRKNARKGGYYRRAVVEGVRSRIRFLYSEIGFAGVFVEEEVRVDARNKAVDVLLKVHEGKPVYVHKVKIEGNYETRDYVIRRELRVQEHSLAIRGGLSRSRSRILNLGYYEDVQLQPFPAGEGKTDLLVKIRERFTGQFSVGLTYNEITKLSGFASIRKGNFLGTGDILGLSLSYGDFYRDNSLSYTDRWFLGKPIDLTTSIFDRRIVYTTYTIQRTGASFTLSREFWEYWRFATGVSAQRIVYSDIAEDASSFVKGQEGARESRKLTFYISRDTRDYFLFPTEGSYIRLDYSVAVPVFGGTEQFHKVILTGSKFFKDTYFDSGFVFMSKATLGFVEPYGGVDVPLDERLFVGGDFTIRGYNYGMAGTVDVNGDPIGSTREVILNFELNYKLHKLLYFALFYDTGIGADRNEDLDPSNWRGGYGMGIRFITPMAPLRLDWAWKTRPVPGDREPSRVHFIIGGFF